MFFQYGHRSGASFIKADWWSILNPILSLSKSGDLTEGVLLLVVLGYCSCVHCSADARWLCLLTHSSVFTIVVIPLNHKTVDLRFVDPGGVTFKSDSSNMTKCPATVFELSTVGNYRKETPHSKIKHPHIFLVAAMFIHWCCFGASCSTLEMLVVQISIFSPT